MKCEGELKFEIFVNSITTLLIQLKTYIAISELPS